MQSKFKKSICHRARSYGFRAREAIAQTFGGASSCEASTLGVAGAPPSINLTETPRALGLFEAQGDDGIDF